jgi:hypothetical protein
VKCVKCVKWHKKVAGGVSVAKAEKRDHSTPQ